MAYVDDDSWLSCKAWLGNCPLDYTEDDVRHNIVEGGYKKAYSVKLRKNPDCSRAHVIVTWYNEDDANEMKRWGLTWTSTNQYAVVRSIHPHFMWSAMSILDPNLFPRALKGPPSGAYGLT